MRRFLAVTAALLAVATVIAGGIFYYQYSQLLAFAAAPHAVTSETVVTIEKGAGPRSISAKLGKVGAITDAQRFEWNIRYLRKVAGQLKAGEYTFRPGEPQTPDAIVDRLLKGEVLSLKVTIPEGLRIDEQAPLFLAAGLPIAPAEYTSLARSKSFVKSLGVDGESLEGYLFPDTYLVPRTTDTATMLRLMVERFRRAFAQAEAKRLPGITLTEAQAVTLASIVEKETAQPAERPRISCVFHNRLRKDMKLQTDPTVIYSIILRKGFYDGNIHKSDLEAPHPYNTYSVKGLPPGPIASAGQAALEAALAPLTCDDLFFVSRNDTTHVFCPTLACHEAAVQEWQVKFFREKRARGG